MRVLNIFKGTTVEKLSNRDKIAYANAIGHQIESPVANQQCKFPFTFKGNTYKKCTTRGRGIPISTHYFEGMFHQPHWCATDVDDDNVMIDGKWGYCSDECLPDTKWDDILENPMFNVQKIPKQLPITPWKHFRPEVVPKGENGPKMPWRNYQPVVIPKGKDELETPDTKTVDGYDNSYDYVPQAKMFPESYPWNVRHDLPTRWKGPFMGKKEWDYE